ncbi:MDR family MFS transporter [Agrilactobacillus fermenti]|uniref:MDR family MFS transporter n=1 Tax=Agrilactobacillus fermenti TaxID=2586909 RepID=UPI001E301273|nr:MDR family MFS transporter [Agrilactobacillus fermenti]MCD2256739.1 multidrug efflux MFS transporter [Agrilactobacillus fermenti]
MANSQVTDVNGKPYNRMLLLMTVIVGTFTTVLTQTLLATAYPTLMKAFDISTSTVQWLTTGFLLVNGIMIPISAFLINRFNSKYLYISAMTIFFIGTVICYIAPSFAILLTGRLIEAMGVGLSMPLMQTVSLSIFPPERRGAAMGMAGLAIGLAPAIGPTLSGWVIDNYSWRTLFGMILPIAGLVIFAAFFFMKKVLETSKPTLDVLSALLSTVGFGSLLYGFSEVGDKGWGSAIVISTLIIGVIFIVLFGWRQLRLEHPFLELRVFTNGTFTISAILSSVVNMAMVGAEMVLPLYMQTVRGDTALQSGLTLLPGALMIGIMSPITGQLFDRLGAKRLAMTGLTLLTLGTIPFVFLTENTPMIEVTILYAVRMFGISMVMMPVTTAGMNALSYDLISHGTAVNNTVRQVASSVGTAILISVLSNVTNNQMPTKHVLKTTPLLYKDQAMASVLSGYHAAFAVAALFCVVGLAISFFLKEKRNHQEVAK